MRKFLEAEVVTCKEKIIKMNKVVHDEKSSELKKENYRQVIEFYKGRMSMAIYSLDEMERWQWYE